MSDSLTVYRVAPEVRTRMIGAFGAKATVREACAIGGISPDTFYRWMRDAEADPDGEMGEFAREVEAARAQRKMDYVRAVEEHGEAAGDWRARAWLLERLYPADFGKATGRTLTEAEVTALMRLVYDGIGELLVDHLRAARARVLAGLNGEANDPLAQRMIAALDAAATPAEALAFEGRVAEMASKRVDAAPWKG